MTVPHPGSGAHWDHCSHEAHLLAPLHLYDGRLADFGGQQRVPVESVGMGIAILGHPVVPCLLNQVQPFDVGNFVQVQPHGGEVYRLVYAVNVQVLDPLVGVVATGPEMLFPHPGLADFGFDGGVLFVSPPWVSPRRKAHEGQVAAVPHVVGFQVSQNGRVVPVFLGHPGCPQVRRLERVVV